MDKLDAEALVLDRKNVPGIAATGAVDVKGKRSTAPRMVERLDMLLAGISLGKSVRKMCAQTGISQRTLWNWLAADEELMRQYQRAKELCVDAYAEEIIEISDDGSNDTHVDEKGREVVNREVLARTQLRIDARKWYAARLAPRKYGDKLPVTHEGNDARNPVAQRIEVAFIAPPGPHDRQA